MSIGFTGRIDPASQEPALMHTRHSLTFDLDHSDNIWTLSDSNFGPFNEVAPKKWSS